VVFDKKKTTAIRFSAKFSVSILFELSHENYHKPQSSQKNRKYIFSHTVLKVISAAAPVSGRNQKKTLL
jgi:hypothetical protein